jgi:PAS domain S-box-containing protein
MQELNTDTRMEGAALVRVTALFEENQSGIYARTDRLLAKLMILQWMAGIAAALWVSPKTWAGASSQMHWHVWAAIFLGGVITSFPVWLAWKQPGRPLTRHTIAFAQMLTSGLLIHLTGGRIETHFHVFGSLAFLAFYRDWRVLITATVVVAVDHLLRGLFWPQSVYGVLAASSWRSVEHAGWVIFEDTFLIISIRQSLNEMFEVATRRAKLEALNTGIERQVTERTAELTREIAERIRGRAQLEAVIQAMQDGVMVFDTEGQAVLVNEAEARINGFASAAEMKQSLAFFAEIYELTDLAGKPIPVEQWPVSRILRGETVANWELRGRRNDTGQEWVFSFGGAPARDEQGKQILAVTITRDITERKRTEAELEKAQKDLVLASRQAGMAEVATGVLHNVGNVLNSANVTTSLISDNLKSPGSVIWAKPWRFCASIRPTWVRSSPTIPKAKSCRNFWRGWRNGSRRNRPIISKNCNRWRRISPTSRTWWRCNRAMPRCRASPKSFRSAIWWRTPCG